MKKPEMNIPRLEAVKAKIRSEPNTFDMNSWGAPNFNGDCGTAFCIAGHAVHMFAPEVPFCGISEKAQELLGLTQAQAFGLFMPQSIPYDDVTVDDAVAAIDSLITTGAAIWPDTLGI